MEIKSVTITITDNESAPTVTLSVSATSIAENAGTSLTLTATLSNGTYQDVTVALSTSGTATEGTDYTDGSGAIDDMTISAGSTTTTANFTPTNDSTNEGNETATIAVSGVSGGSASESGSQSVTITITDDDNFSFSVDDVTVAENAGSATITVDMSSASASSTTIQYATSNVTATAGPDYGGTSGTLNFNTGDTSETFTVLITNDSVYEGNETFTVTLSNASAGSISDNEATVTITDDESAPTVSLSTSASSIDENSGSNITLTATLSGTTDSAITVALDTSGTATEGTDYSDDGGTSSLNDITISAGSTTGTVTFNPTTDTVCEIGNETATIAINGVSGKSGVNEDGDQSQTITITEPDEFVCGTQLTYNASNATTKAGETEFDLVNNSGYLCLPGGGCGYWTDLSTQNPFEVVNIHKAKGGYGLTGDNQLVGIMDTGWNTSHSEFNASGRSFTNYNTLTSATSSGYHGASVESILAADDDGSGVEGVASMADIRRYQTSSIFLHLDGGTLMQCLRMLNQIVLW